MSSRSEARNTDTTEPIQPGQGIPLNPGSVPIEPAPGGIEPDTPIEAVPMKSLDRRNEAKPFGESERRARTTDRRTGIDRRVLDIGTPTGLERRRGPGRRLSDDRKSAEEGNMSDEQFEFVLAIDTYKRLNGRPFPSWTEVLEVIKQLGYRKVATSTLNLPEMNEETPGAMGDQSEAPRATSSEFFHG